MSVLFITSTHIGDAILSTGLLAHLLARYPNDGVTIACGAPAAKIFTETPRLEAIHVVRKRARHGHWWDLYKQVAPKPWRAVVDLRRSALPWGLMTLRRFGKPKSREPIHRVELIARTMGLPPQDPVIWTGEEHRARAAAFLEGARAPVLLAPGASWRGKIWPAERFAELAERLRAPDGPVPGADIVMIGAKGERATGAAVEAAIPAANRFDGFGLDVLTTYEVARRCRLMVGNDSAMMHLSAAAGIPTVGLFGPTRDEHYAPWGPNGLVVRTPESVEALTGWDGYDTTTTDTMMTGLGVDAVLAAVRRAWPTLAAS